eukprot:scaffold157849_cov18-Prasinocladus_malaysianus.AAC.1
MVQHVGPEEQKKCQSVKNLKRHANRAKQINDLQVMIRFYVSVPKSKLLYTSDTSVPCQTNAFKMSHVSNDRLIG